MIQENKQNNALFALNAVLFRARAMALHEVQHQDLAAVLDCAEYLVRLIARPEDATEEFREMLVDLAHRYPAFLFAIERFDQSGVSSDW